MSLIIGIYPYSDNTTKWLVFDIDVPDANEVIQIKGKLAHHSIYGYLEDSGRNWHLWVFFDKPVSNHIARKLAHFFIEEAGCRNPVEVFPKQDIIPDLGSCIKLPLGIHRKTGKKCLFVNENQEPFQNQTGFLTSIGKVTEAEVKDIFQTNGVEIGQKGEGRVLPVVFAEPCVEKYWQKGAKEGQRNLLSYQLAIRLREKDMPERIALEELKIWRTRCDPGTHLLTDTEIKIQVYNAYNKSPLAKMSCIHKILQNKCIGRQQCPFHRKFLRQGSGKHNDEVYLNITW